MSLESIQKEIQISVDSIKQEISREFDEKRQNQRDILEKEYIQAKENTSKLIEREEKEKFVGSTLEFKMNEKKKVLQARQEIIDEILQKVKTSLEELLGSDIYYSFIQNRIQQYAQDGDSVYLSNRDYQKFSEKIKTSIPTKVNLQQKESLEGGVIIEKSNFDYNFSISSIIEEHYYDIENYLGQKFYD